MNSIKWVFKESVSMQVLFKEPETVGLIANEPGRRRREQGEAAASQSRGTFRKQGEQISTWM